MIKIPNRIFLNNHLSGKYDYEKKLSKYNKILIAKIYLLYWKFCESRPVYFVQHFYYISIEVLTYIFMFWLIRNTISKILRHNDIWCWTPILLITIGHTKSGYHYFLFWFFWYLQFAFFCHTSDLSSLMVLWRASMNLCNPYITLK